MIEIYLAYLEMGLIPERHVPMLSWAIPVEYPKILDMDGIEKVVYLRKMLNKSKLSKRKIRKMVNKNALNVLKVVPKDMRKLFVFKP